MKTTVSPVSIVYQMTDLVYKIKQKQTAELTYALLTCIMNLVESGHLVTIQLITGEIHSVSQACLVRLTKTDILKLIQDIGLIATITPHIYTRTKSSILPQQSNYHH